MKDKKEYKIDFLAMISDQVVKDLLARNITTVERDYVMFYTEAFSKLINAYAVARGKCVK